MLSKKMKIKVLFTLLAAVLLIGCQIGPLAPEQGAVELSSVDSEQRFYPGDPTITFINLTGQSIASVHCIMDGQLVIERHYSPAVAVNGVFSIQMPSGNYQFAFFNAPYVNGMQPIGFISSTQIFADGTQEIHPVNGGSTDPAPEVTVNFVNLTGSSIGELRYRQAMAMGDEEQIEVFNPPIANNGTFSLTMPAGVYSFVAFEQANNPINPLAMVDGIPVDQGTTIDLAASTGGGTGGEPEMVDVTFHNISGSTVNAIYWRYAGDTSAPLTKVPISPASVNNSSFNLTFPNGLYQMQFCYESGGNVEVIVELNPLPLSPESNNIHIVNSTPPF